MRKDMVNTITNFKDSNLAIEYYETGKSPGRRDRQWHSKGHHSWRPCLFKTEFVRFIIMDPPYNAI